MQFKVGKHFLINGYHPYIIKVQPYIHVKNIFLNFKIPSGRGDISKVKLKNKNIYLVDETYNSNPLSLKTALEKM